MTDGKLCEELVHQLEASLKTLSDDEILIDGLLQKTSTEIPADEKIMHGMDAVRHGLVRIKFFEHSDCRLTDVNTAEIDVVKSECEKLSVQNSVGGSIAHSMALCETIFGVKSSLVYEEAANHPRTETSVWQPGFFSHFYNWVTGNNECKQIGNGATSLECRSVK